MKYIIDVPDEVAFIKLAKPYNVYYGDQELIEKDQLTPYTKFKKDTENEVWDFVRSCLVMDGFDFVEAFDSCSYINLLEYSYQEAKAKYEAWLKQKDELNFGDEIISVDDVKAVMFDRADNESIHVMTEHGCVEQWKNLDVVKKTGKKIFQG